MSRGFRLQVETLDGRDLPDANPAAMMTAPIPADTTVVLAQAVPLRPPVPNDLPPDGPRNDLPPDRPGPVPLLPQPALPPLLLPPEPIPIQPVMPVVPPRVELLPARPLEPELPPQRGLPIEPRPLPQILEPRGPIQVVPPINPESLFPSPYPADPGEIHGVNPFLPEEGSVINMDRLIRSILNDQWHQNQDGTWTCPWPLIPVNPTP